MLPGSENILSFTEFFISFPLINIRKTVEIPQGCKMAFDFRKLQDAEL